MLDCGVGAYRHSGYSVDFSRPRAGGPNQVLHQKRNGMSTIQPCGGEKKEQAIASRHAMGEHAQV